MDSRIIRSDSYTDADVQKAYSTLDNYEFITSVDASNGFNPNIRLILNGAFVHLSPLMKGSKEVLSVSEVEIQSGLSEKLGPTGQKILSRCSIRNIDKYYGVIDERAVRTKCNYQSDNPYLNNFVHNAVAKMLFNDLMVPHDLINMSIKANLLNITEGIRIPQFTDPFRPAFFNLYTHVYSDTIIPIGMVCRKNLMYNYDASIKNGFGIIKQNRAGDVEELLKKYVSIDRALAFKDKVSSDNPLLINDISLVSMTVEMNQMKNKN